MTSGSAGPMFQDTIVAVATPPGRGGIGVVRLSGPDALRIAGMLVQTRREPRSHRVRYGAVLDRDGHAIDDALLTWFAAPHSYTGEEVVEISTHGAPVVVQTVFELSLEHGARLAHAGEFTERAFLNGRMDLSQAEAVRDLIDASTVAQARLAAEQLGGSLQRELRPVQEALLHLIAAVEAGIDFAEDDLETLPAAEIAAQITTVQAPLARLLASFAHGRVLREGLRIALVGAPNAGKSSLFNRLLERERAIVTPIAGTTRDAVSERAVIAGVPVELVDTAGLRETDDVVERMGVARSYEAMADADVVLYVMEAGLAAAALASGGVAVSLALDGPTLPEEEMSDAPRRGAAATGFDESETARTVLRVYSKADLLGDADRATLQHADALLTSASTGEGLGALRSAVLRMSGAGETAAAHAVLTNVRQRDSIQRAVLALDAALRATTVGTPHEMLLLDLYEALRGLDELLGQTTPDDVLHRIFSTFCIGK